MDCRRVASVRPRIHAGDRSLSAPQRRHADARSPRRHRAQCRPSGAHRSPSAPRCSMNKTLRHHQILKLIRQKTVYTQEELARELTAIGVPATQVTLSRDIRELGLIKTNQGYQQIYSEPPGPPLSTVVAEFLTDVRVAKNLLVLRTTPAHASSIALA